MKRKQMLAWLDECAAYYEKRDTGGEDKAHWANVYNAKNARAIRDYIASMVSDVPEGWQAVPQTPTYDMVLAGANYIGHYAWSPMLKAAPESPL